MRKIEWCLKQKCGIELIESNENLSEAYTKKAEDALRAAAKLKDNKDWEISSCYYSMYFSVYAILMKIGIKCEIHACTITFVGEFLNQYFSDEDVELLKKSMKARIDTQYYSDRNVTEAHYENMIQGAPEFLAKSKTALQKITNKEIQDIRNQIKELKIV